MLDTSIGLVQSELPRSPAPVKRGRKTDAELYDAELNIMADLHLASGSAPAPLDVTQRFRGPEPSTVQVLFRRLLSTFPSLRRFLQRTLAEPRRPDMPDERFIEKIIAAHLHDQTGEPLAALIAERLKLIWRADINAALAKERQARR